MSLEPSRPILYLITPGATDEKTTPESPEFNRILLQISSAVTAGVQLIQLREKHLTARGVFNLAQRAVELAHGTSTRILVNDRADIAAAAGAAGVHLTTQSVEVDTIRMTFGKDFLIGASTHSLAEAQIARESGADFVVFGPVFPTYSKEKYGPPVGLEQLAQVANQLRPFPVLALGGISTDNAAECLRAGASGIAGITLFSKPELLRDVVVAITQSATGITT